MTETLQDNLAALAALADPRPTDVPGVVDRLARIAERAAVLSPRGEEDGIACFTRLYHQITVDVLAGYDAGELFSCPGDFILELDVAFARRYLDALAAHGGGTAPGCWQLLFERRRDEETDPWRFAAAGVNAHVNFDLAFALLDVWERHRVPLGTPRQQYDDYLAINTIFERNMDELCNSFDAPWSDVGGHGSIFDRAGNVLGDILVTGTRDLAWTFAERMWSHRGRPDYRTVPEATLDRLTTGLARALI
ncbi:DUF5995 family protein [Actinomycetospora cinnamomea]|uniref:Uncharacterized protein n=1 Tax=Actinomycetospora cinnamomea TaxID=663609 RepID=A0A2U1FIP7_9PSEU|nr:DUF5995 family protein [Actinomycetospora cinnamomea]PVZ12056.1 hypothetical protein C8D89_103387 [Actinomycetospora cinnamomea]